MPFDKAPHDAYVERRGDDAIQQIPRQPLIHRANGWRMRDVLLSQLRRLDLLKLSKDVREARQHDLSS
jgi:hypothetical protein